MSRPSLGDALRPGREIAAAGYVLYGPSTIFVLSTGQGAHGFTLDPNIGEFFLSQPDIRCPSKGACFSVNEGNFARWSPEIQKWSQWIKSENYGARYVGSLVADAHRTLIKGGIFAYPADAKSKNGKLRLLYEANPMAFLFEQAGGAATDGKDRILDIMPDDDGAGAGRHREAGERGKQQQSGHVDGPEGGDVQLAQTIAPIPGPS